MIEILESYQRNPDETRTKLRIQLGYVGKNFIFIFFFSRNKIIMNNKIIFKTMMQPLSFQQLFFFQITISLSKRTKDLFNLNLALYF